MVAYLRAFGPLFDGRAYAELGRFGPKLTSAVGREAKNRVVGHMASTQRRPSPYLWTTTTFSPHAGGTRVYGNEDLPYENWIEGTGTRNSPVTSFEGYHAFSTVTRGVPGWFASVVQPTVTETIRRLNG